MSRKYKQHGYQDSEAGARRPRSDGEAHPGRGRVETRYRRTIRCVECSAMFQFMDTVKITDQCKNCNADIHTCRNCKSFDPDAPHQCMKPIPARVESKNDRNMCELFSPKILIEKVVEERNREESSADAARKAFDALFK
jgi:hypothetical protein